VGWRLESAVEPGNNRLVESEPLRYVVPMLKIGSFVMNCNDFPRSVSFWAEALGLRPDRSLDGDWVILKDPDGQRPNVAVQASDDLKFGRNRMHLDLYAGSLVAEVKRLKALGARVHQEMEPGSDFVIMADPEGKLFCVVQDAK
jgi:predicted enzyme related to lactoylglutathione lyase